MTEKFGNTWWGKQWLNAFHQIDYNTRLPRGRAYASQRAVLHLHWEQAQEPNPVLYAQVKGSRAEPYSQMIRWPSFSEAEKQQMLTLLSQQPDWQAQLARQEFPPALYRALEQRSLRLFIEKWEDVQAQCTCPDWQVPCKHLAAVIYTLANEIDQNPALIFKSRGLDLTLPSPTQSTRSLNDAFADWKSFFLPNRQHLLLCPLRILVRLIFLSFPNLLIR
ncbi:MAG: hypothetical protein HC880_16405 [Bacteroidia bacterium]|nr:hypothetical protein [Bacteroidia bacterium]